MGNTGMRSVAAGAWPQERRASALLHTRTLSLPDTHGARTCPGVRAAAVLSCLPVL